MFCLIAATRVTLEAVFRASPMRPVDAGWVARFCKHQAARGADPRSAASSRRYWRTLTARARTRPTVTSDTSD